VISKRRRRKRSTHTPAKRLTSRAGAEPAAESNPICQGVAPSMRAAISGRASAEIWDPTSEIAEAAQNLRKPPWRVSPPGPAWGATVGALAEEIMSSLLSPHDADGHTRQYRQGARADDPAYRSHPDSTQELPRKLLPTRAKETQSRFC